MIHCSLSFYPFSYRPRDVVKKKSTTPASKRDMLHLLHLKRRRSGTKDSAKTKNLRNNPLPTMIVWVETMVKWEMITAQEGGAWVAGVLAVSAHAAMRSYPL